MSDSPSRYLVAKSDWHAKQVLKKIRQGRVEPDKVPLILMGSHEIAKRRIGQMPLGSQELYSVYRVDGDYIGRVVGSIPAPQSTFKRIYQGYAGKSQLD